MIVGTIYKKILPDGKIYIGQTFNEDPEGEVLEQHNFIYCNTAHETIDKLQMYYIGLYGAVNTFGLKMENKTQKFVID